MSAERLLIETLNPESIRQCSLQITEELRGASDEERRGELLVILAQLVEIRASMQRLLSQAKKREQYAQEQDQKILARLQRARSEAA